MPLIWVIRGGYKKEEMEKWLLEDGFEERVKGRGFLIRGWAPQVLILSHPAIGGFLTHCGWNSTLEGICGGIPMITWPLFGEQFFNEKFIVHVLEIGVRVGVEVVIHFGDEEKFGVLVKRENIKEAVGMVMGEGEEKEKRRERVRQLAEMAKKAIEEGGSSYLNITLLLEDIRQAAKNDRTKA
jgi:UDP-glucosyl transferase 73C